MALEAEARQNARYGVSVLQGKQLSECDYMRSCLVGPCYSAMLCLLHPWSRHQIDLCSHPVPASILARAQLRDPTWAL